jgi:hypothetical protein
MPPTRRHNAGPPVDPASISGTTAAAHNELEIRAGAALERLSDRHPDDLDTLRVPLRSVLHSQAIRYSQDQEFAATRLVQYLRTLALVTSVVRESRLQTYDMGGNPIAIGKFPPFALANAYLAAYTAGDPIAASAAAHAMQQDDAHFELDLWIDRSAAAILKLP